MTDYSSKMCCESQFMLILKLLRAVLIDDLILF